MKHRLALLLLLPLTACLAEDPLRISGIYPHLAAFNKNAECGIGAVVPWADRLWWITYPPHARTGSSDKLYSTDENLALVIHPESVGGTHAARLIHRETRQLFIGPYAIDAEGEVRALDVEAIPGRYTAWARHLSEPAEKLYLFDMEGPIWEVNVKSLQGTKLFTKPQPGWHGKGAYTGQGRLVIANNGEHAAGLSGEWELPRDQWSKEPEDAGVLAEWDGKDWRTVLRRQFTDVTGPGGIRGNEHEDDPVWAMGWDRRSVLLMVLENGEWSRFRVPKASHAMDPTHGWYTEWPRIRPIGGDRALMCMHGMFFDFPLDFSAGKARGIRAIASHLRYVPDFCDWNGKLVLAADDTSIMQNPLAGQSQSNLWFGSVDELETWGPGFAFGGPWLGDRVAADTPSDAYLFAGFESRMVHLATGGDEPLEVSFEIDRDGTGDWTWLETVTIPESGYTWHTFPDSTPGEWIRARIPREATISVYFHYGKAAGRVLERTGAPFAGMGGEDTEPLYVRPAGHNRNLQIFGHAAYYEADETLTITRQAKDRPDDRDLVAAHGLDVAEEDAASLIITDDKGNRYRLPRFAAQPDIARQIREVQSERTLAQLGNIFYEVPRGQAGKHVLDFHKMRPISAHLHAIHDFCSWRGLLILTGASVYAEDNEHIFRSEDGQAAVWAGCVDDLWALGKPRGEGGPWKNSPVQAGEPSDPYLMTGFDGKTLTLSHDLDEPVTFRVEVDYSNRPFWKLYREITVPAGETVTHRFADGYSAHWVRFVPGKDCEATAWLTYD